MELTRIRNVRPWGCEASDVLISHVGTPEARISEVTPHSPEHSTSEDSVIEGRGRLLLPSFSDVHVHLDSTRIGLPFRAHTGSPGIWGMMLNDRANWRYAEASIVERATTTLGQMIARGTTRVRAFGQVDVDCKLERLEAVLSARERFSDAVDMEVVAFPQAGILREEGAASLLESAIRSGADVVGGIDPCALDRDPARHLDIVFGLAEKHQKPIDIHLHEPGTLGAFTTELILERTRALDMRGNVNISHAFHLGSVDAAILDDLMERLAELDISLTTVALPPPRNLPLGRAMEAGVRMGLGQDGQRDYWSPYGNADMLDRTWQLAFTNDLVADRMIEQCLAVATLGGSSIIDPTSRRAPSSPEPLRLEIGDPAELLVLDGETPTSAVMDRGSDRTVIHQGLIVAEGMRLS